MNRTKGVLKAVLLSTVVALGIAGCQQKTQETSVSSTEDSKQVNFVSSSEESTNATQLSAFSQLEDILKRSKQVTLGNSVFSSNELFSADEQNFALTVDKAAVYEVKQVTDTLKNEFNFETKPGGLFVMHVSIKNKTNETMYYPIEELKLSFNEATLEVAPSFQLYPAEEGNLAQSLTDTKGEISGGQTVEGYLVFGLGGESFEHVKKDGYYYVKIVPPKRTVGDIAGVGANALGDEQLLYLPLNKEAQSLLLANAKHIQDRLTTEFWGQKTVLSDQNVSLKQSSQGVDVEVKRVEVSDFVPNSYNEDAFRNFKYGAVIVSVEYDVTNNTKETLLPIDGKTVLTINGDEITSDYVLTNQVYGKELAPGKTYRVVKTFALDKKRYQEQWQEQPYMLSVAIPEKGPITDSGSVSSKEEESDEVSSTVPPTEVKTYQVMFNFTPKLQQLFNADLELKRQSTSDNATSSSSMPGTSASDESQSSQ